MQMEREQGMMRGANEVCPFPSSDIRKDVFFGGGFTD